MTEPFAPLKMPKLPPREANQMVFNGAMQTLRLAADARQAGNRGSYKSLREGLSMHEARCIFDFSVGQLIAARNRPLDKEDAS